MVALKLAGGRETLSDRIGSRNAVVALKLVFPRGKAMRLDVKQERRGGIETQFWEGASSRLSPEAGTPWWH